MSALDGLSVQIGAEHQLARLCLVQRLSRSFQLMRMTTWSTVPIATTIITLIESDLFVVDYYEKAEVNLKELPKLK